MGRGVTRLAVGKNGSETHATAAVVVSALRVVGAGPDVADVMPLALATLATSGARSRPANKGMGRSLATAL